VTGRHERRQAVPLHVRLEHQRARLGHGPLRARDPDVAVEQFSRADVFGKLRVRVHAREHAPHERRVGDGDAARLRLGDDPRQDCRRLRLVAHDRATPADGFERLLETLQRRECRFPRDCRRSRGPRLAVAVRALFFVHGVERRARR